MTDKISVSGEKLINTIREVAAEHPDYVYVAPVELGVDPENGPCFYVHPSTAGPVPGCIMGVTFSRLGVPLDVLAEYEHDSAGSVIQRVLDVTAPLAFEARVFANAAQDAQDGAELDGRRRTWSEAVSHAERRANTELV